MNLLIFSTKQWILIGSAAVSALIGVIYFLFFPYDLITISYLSVIIISAMLFPISFYEYSVNSRITIIEEQFPIFLKDMADNLNAGLSMTDAVRTLSKNDYKTFNSEIRKLSNQMSWGVSFENAIMDIIKSLKQSVAVSRGLAVLLQAFKSGGDISPIMNSVAESTIILQNVQKDQESQMMQQVSIIYMIQLVFIGIIIVLYKVLIPITTSGAFTLSLGSTVPGMGGMQGGGLSTDYYKGFFFITIVIQSACNGLVAGYTKNSSLVAGVRHIAIMLSVSILLFSLFVLPRILSITAASETYSVLKGENFSVIGKARYDEFPVENQRIELIILNTTFYSMTSSSGDYKGMVTAPDTRGRFEGTARVNYEGNTVETAFTINVR